MAIVISEVSINYFHVKFFFFIIVFRGLIKLGLGASGTVSFHDLFTFWDGVIIYTFLHSLQLIDQIILSDKIYSFVYCLLGIPLKGTLVGPRRRIP